MKWSTWPLERQTEPRPGWRGISNREEAAMSGHRYKFQGLLTLHPGAGSGGEDGVSPWELPVGQRCRIVVKAENQETHGTHFFNALVSNPGDGSEWCGDDHAIVTVSVAVEEPPEDYFPVGAHFALWLAGDVADGVVTRRLFI
jgi:hypothetical protein